MKSGMFIIWFLMTLLFCVVLVEPELHSDPEEFFGTMILWLIVAVLAIVTPQDSQQHTRK